MKQNKRKGISPVIATVILVAITIAVAIAVAFWMTGIVGLFAGAVEKLEITSIYAKPETNQWTVTLRVNNTGTTPTSIDMILINGVSAGGADCPVQISPAPPISLDPGTGKTITLTIKRNDKCGPTTFAPGISVEVRLHTTGGKEYPKLTVLP